MGARAAELAFERLDSCGAAGPPRPRANRARRSWIGRGAAVVKPEVLPANVLASLLRGRRPDRRVARSGARVGPHAGGVARGGQHGVRVRRRAGSAGSRTGGSSATRSPPTPRRWLGPEHVARFGADPGLLVKLLDAGQRLPVHFHPGRAFAPSASASRTGRPRPGSSSRPSPGRPSMRVLAGRSSSTRCAGGCAPRTPRRCSARCTRCP